MNADEREQREAEELAAALHALGSQVGAGATVWARVISDELVRHDAVRERFGDASADQEAWERFHGTALVVAIAIGQVLAFEERVHELTKDRELQHARAEFDRAAPRARALRDLAAHLDAYAVGKGHRQTGKRKPPITELRVEPLRNKDPTTPPPSRAALCVALGRLGGCDGGS